jgi:hypothetical protein
VTKVLELPHLSQYYSMAEMYIRAGRIQAELDSQLSGSLICLGELCSQLGFGEDFSRAAL